LEFASGSTDNEFRDLKPDDRVRNLGQSLFEYNLGRYNLIPVFIKKLNLFSVA